MSGTEVVVKNGTFYALYLLSASNGINAVKLLRSAHFLKQRSSGHSLSVIKWSFLRLSLSVLRKGKGVFVHAIKWYTGSRGKAPLMCGSALDGVEWSTLHPDRSTLGTEPQYTPYSLYPRDRAPVYTLVALPPGQSPSVHPGRSTPGTEPRYTPWSLYPRDRAPVYTLVSLPPGQSPGSHWIVDWAGSRACLDGFGEEKICRPCRGSKPGPPSPWVVSIPSTLPWPFNRPC